ncbi:surfeit locus protein 6-domain-containing protein [Syncephalis plumigaleata]|nr:surfeit locus protein 6-domain-containing protein [Syncephalis plumigaleata]
MDKIIYSLDGLETRLKAHTSVFNDLLGAIPSKFYVAEVNEKLSANDYQKRKKSKEEARKAKKAKLDPANQLSVLELQEAERMKEQATVASVEITAVKGGKKNKVNASKETPKKDMKRKNEPSTPVHNDSEDEEDSDNDSDVDMESEIDDDASDLLPVFSAGSLNGENSDAWMSEGRQRVSGLSGNDESFSTDSPDANRSMECTDFSPSSNSIDALRNKLKARIDALREKRHIESEANNQASGTPAKKGSAKERKEEKRRLREERKLKKKEMEKKQREKSGATGGGSGKEMIFADNATSSNKDEDNMKVDFNFVRFQFEGEKKRHATQGAELEEQANWQRAVKLARGDKLRDDEQLLRKTIKRTAEQKKKSEKAWNERVKAVQEQTEQRQKKRNENIQARIDSKKNKGSKKKLQLEQQKKKKKQQKAHRPGFEGKSMNAKKSSNNKHKS